MKKIVYTRQDSGVLAEGIFFETGKLVEVSDEVADVLLKHPYFKIESHKDSKNKKLRKGDEEK